MFDLLIEGGQVVLPASVVEADVGIAGQMIGAIGRSGVLGSARRRIDARGLYVLPGCIDPHVHLRWPPAPEIPPGLQAGTIAAACGGATTVIDFATQGPSDSLRGTIQRRLAQAEGHVAVDYALHLLMTAVTPQTLAEVGEVVRAGISSFKLMTAYRKLGWMVDDGALYAVMLEAARHAALVGLHAENEDLALHITKQLLDDGKTGVEYYEAGRPSLVEGEAARRAIYLARVAGAAAVLIAAVAALIVDAAPRMTEADTAAADGDSKFDVCGRAACSCGHSVIRMTTSGMSRRWRSAQL